MKTIKIKFVGFSNTINEKDNIIIDILKKHFDVKICNDPDYVFCSIFSDDLAFFKGF